MAPSKLKRYKVTVCRTSYGFHDFIVEATSSKEAGKKAIELASDHVFSEKSSEYSEQDITIIDPVYKDYVHVCAHNIYFYFNLPRDITEEEKSFLKTEAEDRAQSQIIEGYVEGELNYESETLSCRGWWRIER
jgi:hypothetical protein